jgi:hypothetical protein
MAEPNRHHDDQHTVAQQVKSCCRRLAVSVPLHYLELPERFDPHSNIIKSTMGAVLTRLLEIFYTKKLDIVVIGLENR